MMFYRVETKKNRDNYFIANIFGKLHARTAWNFANNFILNYSILRALTTLRRCQTAEKRATGKPKTVTLQVKVVLQNRTA